MTQWEAIKSDAEAGDPACMCELARRYADGIEVDSNRSAAKYWYERAANTEDSFAKVVVGDQYERGIRLDQDCVRAKQLYQRALLAGLPYGAYALGRLHANFLGFCPKMRDLKKARQYLFWAVRVRHMTSGMLLLYLSVKGEFGISGRLIGTFLGVLCLPYIIWTTGRADAYLRWSGWRDLFPENGAVGRRIMRSVPEE